MITKFIYNSLEKKSTISIYVYSYMFYPSSGMLVNSLNLKWLLNIELEDADPKFEVNSNSQMRVAHKSHAGFRVMQLNYEDLILH